MVKSTLIPPLITVKGTKGTIHVLTLPGAKTASPLVAVVHGVTRPLDPLQRLRPDAVKSLLEDGWAVMWHASGGKP